MRNMTNIRDIESSHVPLVTNLVNLANLVNSGGKSDLTRSPLDYY